MEGQLTEAPKAAGEVRRETSVIIAIERRDKLNAATNDVLEELHEAILRMESRLNPVLKSPEPSPNCAKAESEGKRGQMDCDLAEKIQQGNDRDEERLQRIHWLREHCAELFHRIEL